MAMAASFFEKESGCITGSILCNKKSFIKNTAGKDWIAGVFDGSDFYVRNFQPVTRPEMTEARICGNKATGLPVPCIVECSGQSYEVRDGEFEYKTPLAGAYNVCVRAFPYKDFEGILIVTPEQKALPTAEEAAADESRTQTE